MLELQDISVSVENNREILDHINLVVPDSRFIVITGPNGGGKSTLARVISGVQTPSSGRILLDGEDITGLGIDERARRGISFAFQQPVRFKGITVRDLLVLAAKGASDQPLQEKDLRSYLRDVGLCPKDYIDREVNGSLSGGEIKRIEIAVVLARRARLTIFDEPEAGIDLWSFTNLIDVFRRLRSEISGSVVIISHQERILDIADEIVVLSAGRLTAHGPKADILPRLLGGDHCQFCHGQPVSHKKAVDSSERVACPRESV
ncbi:MAG: ATP-binding cassette domain-containing protein [Clostridiales bacterium]|nr:ATP-binding cassette domain-containing protein [Clostridiales bacterium]